MEISVKRTSNHSEQRLFREEVLSFTSHIYMTLAILCRRRHTVAFYRELNFRFSSAFNGYFVTPAAQYSQSHINMTCET